MFDDFTDLLVLHHLLTDSDAEFEQFIASRMTTR